MRTHPAITMLLAAALSVGLKASLSAQSTSQDFPTAITSNEISGSIKARDLGDSRLTSYYYALNGEQGDLFINLVTRNFTGDVDVFAVSGMRPMTKIVVYADYGETETGRAIYLRKGEKLLLRIQGRTPNDDEATFRLKFAGSFAAARPEDISAAPELPKVTAENRGGIRVNSVGTILPAPPRPVEAVEDKAKAETDTAIAKTEKTEDPKPTEIEKPIVPEEARPKPEVMVTDATKPEVESKSPPRRGNASRRRTASRTAEPEKKDPAETAAGPLADADNSEEEKSAAPKPPAKTSPSFRTLANRRTAPPKKPAAPDPLESVNLVIQFKDGTALEKRMSEVFKFSVDKGVLTVILKDRSVTRYPIVDVAKVTIE